MSESITPTEPSNYKVSITPVERSNFEVSAIPNPKTYSMPMCGFLMVKKLTDSAQLPTYGSSAAAGADLYSDMDYQIQPHTCEKISTGIAIRLPYRTFGAIYPRSGMATKRGLRLANCVGVIDEDYRGEILVALYNDTDQVQQVHKGERIAQLVVTPYEKVVIKETEWLDKTDRGSGGFGSTGEK